jgi:antitoxin component YwqK of YwqJK toxin-antitoxin module
MKKQIITLFLLFISFFGHCQFGPNDDAVYLDSLNNIGNEENFKYIRVIKDFTQKKDLYDVSFYNRSGKLERRGNVTNKFLMTNEGLWIYFYENGNRKRIVNYSNKKINGKQFEWYENGHLRLESDVIYDKKNQEINY